MVCKIFLLYGYKPLTAFNAGSRRKVNGGIKKERRNRAESERLLLPSLALRSVFDLNVF
jgi:hypothetical protein